MYSDNKQQQQQQHLILANINVIALIVLNNVSKQGIVLSEMGFAWD